MGGSPCSGKSAISEILAKENNLVYYKIDDYERQHIEQALPNEQPVMYKFAQMDKDPCHKLIAISCIIKMLPIEKLEVTTLYDKMRDYVEALFDEQTSHTTKFCSFPFRKRIDNIRRVFQWAQRLMEEEEADEVMVLTAAIFHDAGYAVSTRREMHPYHSAQICKNYMEKNSFPQEFIEEVSYLILNHSKKKLLQAEDVKFELVLLLEADLLDETGALSIVWDSMVEGMQEEQSFEKTYYHIKEYSGEILEENPMVSNSAKKFWKNKQLLVKQFLHSLAFDLGIKKEVM